MNRTHPDYSLSRLLSPVACQALLSRALYLTRPQFRFLEEVRAGTPPGACLERMGERMRDVDAGEAGKGILSVICTLLDLVVRFIGEDLTLRVVRQVWTDLPMHEPIGPGRSASQEAAS